MRLRAIAASALVLALGSCRAEVEQTTACARYTACVRALDEASSRETDVDRFDPGGACWGSEAGATLCDRACTRGLAWEARRSASPPEECRP